MQYIHSKENTKNRVKKYVAAAKREENQRRTRGKTNPQANNQSSPMRGRQEPMEEQNRVNEEKDRNTQRQEPKVVTERGKVSEKTIKMTPNKESDKEK